MRDFHILRFGTKIWTCDSQAARSSSGGLRIRLFRIQIATGAEDRIAAGVRLERPTNQVVASAFANPVQ
jgi:hypothetical protein